MAASLTRNGALIVATLGWASFANAGANSVSFTTLVNFNGSDGSSPANRLFIDGAGNIYGTAIDGGTHSDGTLFKLAASSKAFSTIVNFNGGDGASPHGALVSDAAGNLYGVTGGGGQHLEGTVYELPSGSTQPTVLYSFSDASSIGYDPVGGLTADSAGNLYGGTYQGVSSLFRIDAATHALSPVQSLGSVGTGQSLGSDLTSDGKGNLYGASFGGGAFFRGVLFKFSTTTQTATLINSFETEANAQSPIVDSHGNLFGTTYGGGAFGYGCIYEVPANSSTVNVVFSFNQSNGAFGEGSLISDANGIMYGTTGSGGTANQGTIFRFDPMTDALTTLYSFSGSDGSGPASALTPDSSGNLYGVAEQGGSTGQGSVFEISGTGFAPLPEPTSLTFFAVSAPVLLGRRSVRRRRVAAQRLVSLS